MTTNFTQEKGHLHPTPRIPNSSLLFTAALSLNDQIVTRPSPPYGQPDRKISAFFLTISLTTADK